jgi:hypothetical protein
MTINRERYVTASTINALWIFNLVINARRIYSCVRKKKVIAPSRPNIFAFEAKPLPFKSRYSAKNINPKIIDTDNTRRKEVLKYFCHSDGDVEVPNTLRGTHIALFINPVDRTSVVKANTYNPNSCGENTLARISDRKKFVPDIRH